MTAMTPVPKDHPLMIAWAAHKQTEEYANSKHWVVHPQHTEGSLWALFAAGFNAAGSQDIIRLTNGSDGVFAHVVALDGKHYGINLDLLGEPGDLDRKFGQAVADRVRNQAPVPASTDAQLATIVRAFIEKQQISCAETIYQTDRVAENAMELIEGLANVVGYYQYPDETEGGDHD